MGRVSFFWQAEPVAVETKPVLDRSDRELQLGQFVRFSSEHSSEISPKLAVEPSVTLAHDPHDPLALLEQFTTQRRAAAAGPQGAVKSIRQSKVRPNRAFAAPMMLSFPPENSSMCAREFSLNARQVEKRGI